MRGRDGAAEEPDPDVLLIELTKKTVPTITALKGSERTVRGSCLLDPCTTCTNARMEARKTTKMSNKLSSVFQKVKESFIPKGTCHFPLPPTKIEHTDDE